MRGLRPSYGIGSWSANLRRVIFWADYGTENVDTAIHVLIFFKKILKVNLFITKEEVAMFLKNFEMKAHFGWNQAVPCIRIWTCASIHYT